MFRAFFSALSSLTRNTETLAASMAEANSLFRQNLALDDASEPAALPAPEESDTEPTRKNGRKTATR